MASVIIQQFSGILPSKNAAVIPANVAQVANNCILWHGDLRPLKAPKLVLTPTGVGATIRTIYRIGMNLPEAQYWMVWSSDVDVVRGMIADDTSERTYFTGAGVPQVTNLQMATQGGTRYPVNAYSLGVPTPTVKPNLSAGSTDAPAEGRAYGYTYVNSWGEEGSISPVETVNVTETGTVTISGMPPAPAGNYDIRQKRIYRSLSGTTGNAAYQFVAEIPDSQTTFVDSILKKNLGEVLSTMSFVPPPSDMVGLTALPNGIMAGFVGYDVCFCEPFTPYAWKPQYRLTADYPIVGLGAFGSSLVVCTKGTPYLISGVHPESMTMEKIELNQACVSKRSIVSVGGGVIYASPDGLVYVGSGGSKILTMGLFTRDEWQAINPSGLSGYYYDGKYIALYESGGGFILNSQEDSSLTTFDGTATAGYSDRVTGSLYLAIGGQIKRFNSGAAETFTWKSKKFQFIGATTPSAARVDADAYPVTFKIYYDGVLNHTQVVGNERAFRLPSGIRPREVELEVSGTAAVRSAGIANSTAELGHG